MTLLEAFSGFLPALLDIAPMTLLFIAIGVIIGQVVAVLPGLGGVFILVLLLPAVYTIDPAAALGLLLGAAVTSGTGNTVTAVLFGIPGSPTGVPVVFDGYPAARRGQAARAIAAGVTASALGGVIGALVLVALIPVARPVTLALGPPEFFLLILAALVFMAYVRPESMVKGLLAGALGLALALVGQEPSTASLRYTFGTLYLWDGVPLVPLMIGVFAIAEMIKLFREGGTIAKGEQIDQGVGTREGILDVFRKWRVLLLGSGIGAGVGIIPGLGGSAAAIISYSQAARIWGRKARFGEGAIEGVIAADAPTNSKDGGSLIPTLAFGIPGTASMAVLLIAFRTLGITPGQAVFEDDIDIVWLIVWILIIANVLAAVLVLALTGTLAKLTRVRSSLLVGPIIVVSLFGAYATNHSLGDVYVAIGAGILGYFMSKHNYPRVQFVIGVVLGLILEQNYLLSMRMFGWGFLLRPISLAIILFVVVLIVLPMFKQRRALGAADDVEELVDLGKEQRPGGKDDRP